MAVSMSLVQQWFQDSSKVQEIKEQAVYAKFIARVLYYSQLKLAKAERLSPALHVERWAKETPLADAILFEDRRYNYKNFNEESNRVASVLRRIGATPDTTVALIMDNRPEFLFTIIGANKVGVASGLINTNLTGDALIHALKITHAERIIVGSEHVDKIAAIVDQIDIPVENILVWHDGDNDAHLTGALSMQEHLKTASRANPDLDIALPERRFIYICTSGTTGLPKAVPIMNLRYLQAAYYFGRTVIDIQPDDVMYCGGMPLYHNAGLSQGWAVCITNGAAFAFRRKFSVRNFWLDIERYGATLFTYIGEICRYLLSADPQPIERMHKLRGILGGGLRPEIWADFVERFNIPQVYEYYGATEGNVGIVNLTNREGSLGRLLPGQELVRIDPETEELVMDDAGHLIRCKPGETGLALGKIQNAAQFAGYADKEKNKSKVLENPFGDGNNYFNTGDLLVLQENQYVAFADRLGDTFRWKGENVSTNEVQELLGQYDGVIEANVYGVQVEGQGGRAGAAAMRVRERFDWDAFTAHVNAVLPAYARPVFVRLEDELEMTGSFKYVKTTLKREGFDPAVIASPLFVYDAEKETYVKLTKTIYKKIQSGTFRV